MIRIIGESFKAVLLPEINDSVYFRQEKVLDGPSVEKAFRSLQKNIKIGTIRVLEGSLPPKPLQDPDLVPKQEMLPPTSPEPRPSPIEAKSPEPSLLPTEKKTSQPEVKVEKGLRLSSKANAPASPPVPKARKIEVPARDVEVEQPNPASVEDPTETKSIEVTNLNLKTTPDGPLEGQEGPDPVLMEVRDLLKTLVQAPQPREGSISREDVKEIAKEAAKQVGIIVSGAGVRKEKPTPVKTNPDDIYLPSMSITDLHSNIKLEKKVIGSGGAVNEALAKLRQIGKGA